MTYSRALTILLSATLLTACTGDGESPLDSPAAVIGVTGTISTTDATRASGTDGQMHAETFCEGDVLSVYIEPTSLYGTAPFTFTVSRDGTTLTTATPQRYPADGSAIDLYAFYPAVSGARPAAIPFAAKTNQSGDDDYRASDLMMATPAMGKHSSDDPITLTFRHLLSQVAIRLHQGEHHGTTAVSLIEAELTGSTLMLFNARYKGTYNVDEDAFDTDADISNITAAEAADLLFYNAAKQSQTQYCCLLPPQTLAKAAAGSCNIRLTTGYGRTIEGRFDADLTLTAGHSLVLDVTAYDTYLTVTHDIGINDWTKYKWTTDE